jgi:hypothetical protein
MNCRQHVLNIFLLLLPAAICLVVFYLDPEIKHSLTLNTASYSVLTLYTTNFVHYDPRHLTRNLIPYIIFGLLSLVLYSKLGYERVFGYSLLLILLAVPLFSSMYSVFTITYYGGRSNVYGFSNVTSAVMGMFGYSVALVMSFEKRDYLFAYLFLMFASVYLFVSLYAGMFKALIPLLLSAASFGLIAYWHRRDEAKKKRIIAAYLLAMVYLFFLSTIFPLNIVADGKVTNIMGHFSGLILGMMMPYLTIIGLKNNDIIQFFHKYTKKIR